LGGPNIAAEIYNMEYANARICGSEKWGKPLAKFLRQPQFMVWENPDLVTHEVMGGLKNVYAIGAGKQAIVACLSIYWLHFMFKWSFFFLFIHICHDPFFRIQKEKQ
jgi:hypothetical protein